MSSEWKRVQKDLFNRLARYRGLTVFTFFWVIICSYWGIRNHIETYQFYQLEISVADCLLLQQHQWHFGILILPMLTLWIMRCQECSFSSQILLRYKSRSALLSRQLMDSFFYAFLAIVFLLGIQLAIAIVSGLPLLNWDAQGSLFYASTGMLVHENIVKICLLLVIMYAIKLMAVLALADLLLWYAKFKWSIWFLFPLLTGIEDFNESIHLFHQLFSVQYRFWMKSGRYSLTMIGGIILVLVIYFLGRMLIRNKDIYH